MAVSREPDGRAQGPPLRPELEPSIVFEGRLPRRRLLPRLVVLGISFAVSLLVAELAVRLVRPQEAMRVERGLYAPDPPRRYRLQPGYRGSIGNHVEFEHTVLINRFGLRGAEPLENVGGRPDRLRVLALGDSFTFGVGANEDETYPARLAAHLRAAGRAAQVWNAGAPGYGVPDAVAWYERWAAAPPLQPDVVVLAPFLANDLQDAAPGSPVRVVDGELVVGNDRGGVRRWLYYHSHLFRLFKSSVLEGPIRGWLGLPEPWARRERRAELALYAGRPLPPELAAGFDATDAALERLARLARERHASVLVVLVPSLPQVDPRRWRQLHAALGSDPRQHDPRRPNRLWGTLCERHGFSVLDPTPALTSAVAHGQEVYYPRDQHLTPAGYDLLARQVAARILADGGTAQRPATAP